MRDSSQHRSEGILPLASFLASIVVLVFVIGAYAGEHRILGTRFISEALYVVKDWKENYRYNLRWDPGPHVGVTRHGSAPFMREDGAWPGVTLVNSFVDDDTRSGPVLQLLDMDGQVAHTWYVPVNEVFPRSDRHDWDTTITGAALLENGDVVFNFNEVGIVKLDWCSNVQWAQPHFTHHNIFVSDDGHFWTSGKKPREQKVLDTQYPKTLTLTNLDVVLELSPKGEVLREFDILDVILKADLKGILFANGQQRLYHENEAASFEFTHMNDVEVLDEAMAEYYPLFSAGDIMVSLRNLNLVMVIDGQTHEAKWWHVGSFLRQHDPDFDGHGGISVFDNMGGGDDDNIGFASRIVSIDPVSSQVSISYRANQPADFYTRERGGHQLLPNGNILIAESFEGRIFEVNRRGDVVWQQSLRWDDNRIVLPYQAQRYENRYVELLSANCP